MDAVPRSIWLLLALVLLCAPLDALAERLSEEALLRHIETAADPCAAPGPDRVYALAEAVSSRSVLAVKGLIAKGCDPDDGYPERRAEAFAFFETLPQKDLWMAPKLGGTALVIAAALDEPELVALLVDAGADPGAQYGRVWRMSDGSVGVEPGLTAVHMAAGGGKLRALDALLDSGAEPNLRDAAMLSRELAPAPPNLGRWTIGYTPLMVAAMEGHAEAISLLLRKGALPDLGTGARTTLANGSPAMEPGTTALAFAAWNGHVGAVRALIEGGATVDAPFLLTRMAGNLDTPWERVPFHTPLMVAAEAGHTGAVEALLDAGANIEAFNGFEHEALAGGPPMRTPGWTPLTFAASRGQADVVALLLARGAAPDGVGGRFVNSSPLAAATTFDHPECARLVVEAGASVTDMHLRLAENKPAILALLQGQTESWLDVLARGVSTAGRRRAPGRLDEEALRPQVQWEPEDPQALAFAADDRLLLNAHGATVEVWDMESRLLLRRIRCGSGVPHRTAVAGRGTAAVCAAERDSTHSELRRFDLETGALTASTREAGPVEAVIAWGDGWLTLERTGDRTRDWEATRLVARSDDLTPQWEMELPVGRVWRVDRAGDRLAVLGNAARGQKVDIVLVDLAARAVRWRTTKPGNPSAIALLPQDDLVGVVVTSPIPADAEVLHDHEATLLLLTASSGGRTAKVELAAMSGRSTALVPAPQGGALATFDRHQRDPTELVLVRWDERGAVDVARSPWEFGDPELSVRSRGGATVVLGGGRPTLLVADLQERTLSEIDGRVDRFSQGVMPVVTSDGVLVGWSDGALALDLAELRRLPELHERPASLAASPQGLVAAGYGTELRLIDPRRGVLARVETREKQPHEQGRLGWSRGTERVNGLAWSSGGERLVVGYGGRFVEVFSGRTLDRGERWELPSDAVFHVAAGGERILAEARTQGGANGLPDAVVELAAGGELGPERWEASPIVDVRAAAVSADGAWVAIQDWPMLHLHGPDGGTRSLRSHTNPLFLVDGRLATSHEGALDIRAPNDAEPQCRLEGLGGELGQTPDGRLLLVRDANEVTFVDPARCAAQGRLFLLAGGEWVVLLPDGQYAASLRGVAALALGANGRTVPAHALDAARHRPDRVAAALGFATPAQIEALEAQVAARRERDGWNGADERPSLSVVSSTRSGNRLTLELEAVGAALASLRVQVNGVPVDAASREMSGDSWDGTVQIELLPGENEVEVEVGGARGWSLPIRQLWTGFARGAVPNLWLVSIGVSEYEDPTIQDLSYAAKDAADVERVFESLRIYGPFGEVQTLRLTDAEATADGVLATREFLSRAAPQDVAVLFVAGHGFLDADGEFRFGTVDVARDRLDASGLGYAELDSLLAASGARNRLLLLDTCHSGDPADGIAVRPLGAGVARRALESVDELEDERVAEPVAVRLSERFLDLRRHSGSVVISAAGAGEYALEGEGRTNGLFTAALLEALGGTDGARVTVRELQTSVLRRVEELSGGRQRAVLRQDNPSLDFRLR